MSINKKKVETAVKLFLEAIGEDVKRQGVVDTPRRIANMCDEILAGMTRKADKELEVIFTKEHDEIILVKDIPFYSLCEHHLLPFFGKTHVAYIPSGHKITGLSKLARVVDLLSKKLQIQENLTTEIADLVMKKLKPKGVMVVVEAEHLCMSMRGVKKPGALTITSAVRGVFRKSEKTRSETLFLIKS
ncbi:MAG: GTP cyclohydrolase I FolE [Candidatus Omnitrophica bacterium]|nr:GTP cyclohydrolase I FolE [Candidatus Omnitrophota bacterium]